MVSNDQRVRTQGNFLPIEQYQGLTLLGHADANSTANLGEIKRMHRLTELKHDVVGNIDHRINAADIAAAQALNHPERRSARQVDVTDNATNIAWTRLAREQLHRACFVIYRRDRLDVRTNHLFAVVGGDFACQAGD